MIGNKKILFVERAYGALIPRGITAVIGADIGGTNSNFGIFDMSHELPILLFSMHAKSKEVTNFTDVVKELLSIIQDKYQITVEHALFACAGVVSPRRDFSKPTNLSITIDAHEIKQKTGLRCVYIVNDFEVIGYGIGLIDQKHLVQVQGGAGRHHQNRAILGAGTGLGKSIMFFNTIVERYVPVASEGGHADAALQSDLEFELAKFIQKSEQHNCPISWENLLSGDGIKRIYKFFHARALKNDHNKDEKMPQPDEIFNSRINDKHSRDTFELYTLLYARCAKNFALDALALGGIYIAGGIAAHNLEMFKTELFLKEFTNCGKQSHLLKELPLYVITDYNVSLYGAAYYFQIEDVCDL